MRTLVLASIAAIGIAGFSAEAQAVKRSTVVGAGAGAVVGGVAAGPAGAVVGGVAGGYVGSKYHNRRIIRHHHHHH